MDQCVRSDGQTSTTKWFDNKIVVMVSNKYGMSPIDKCTRWNKKEQKEIQVTCPFSNMCGVDMLDRLMSLYRIRAKIRKWTDGLDIFYCLIFRMKYEEFLSSTEQETSTSEDDPDFELLPSASKRSRTRVPHPPDALRKRHVLHLPEFPEISQENRCRRPDCNSNTARISFSTCKVFLCVLLNRNCFKRCHN
ncbi:hypothetical protein PR048_009827, partial [Dryococelus australis]